MRPKRDVDLSSHRRMWRCAANELAVRKIMVEFRDLFDTCGLNQDLRSSVEISLTEALNNIVEHACHDLPNAEILIKHEITQSGVLLCLHDPGHPFPGGEPPDAQMPGLSEDILDLPEGGFGWGLIRTLATRIDYTRKGGQNHLQLWFAQSEEVG